MLREAAAQYVSPALATAVFSGVQPPAREWSGGTPCCIPKQPTQPHSLVTTAVCRDPQLALTTSESQGRSSSAGNGWTAMKWAGAPSAAPAARLPAEPSSSRPAAAGGSKSGDHSDGNGSRACVYTPAVRHPTSPSSSLKCILLWLQSGCPQPLPSQEVQPWTGAWAVRCELASPGPLPQGAHGPAACPGVPRVPRAPPEPWKLSGQWTARSQECQNCARELSLTVPGDGLSLLRQAPAGQGQLPGLIPAPDINVPRL